MLLRLTVFFLWIMLPVHGQPGQLSIPTGTVWHDTNGNPIHAHGGGILHHKGIYYWYGEYKKGPTRLVPNQDWECYRVEAGGIACYQSTDLQHWTFNGVVLRPDSTDPAHDLHTSKVIERPKVIYNAKTRQFVLWMHIDSEDYGYARTGVAVSNKPTGPFRYLGSLRPNNQMSRDMTLFVDDDGRAYHLGASENNQTMLISQLSSDYLRPSGVYKRILIGQRREAPALFKHKGRYYLITSGCTGWTPNPATWAEADSVLGNWTQRGNPCVGSGADSTFGTQSTFVLPMPGKPGQFLFMADRWNKTDLENSRYAWFPLSMQLVSANTQVRPVIRRPERSANRPIR
jgi:Glycosyl hydrolases family 43